MTALVLVPIQTTLYHVPDGAESLAIRRLLSSSKDQSLLYITATDEKANTLVQQLRCVFPDKLIYHFPAWDCLPYDRLSPSKDIMARRVHVLTSLLTAQQPAIVVTSVHGFVQKLPPKDSLENRSFTLKSGDSIVREDLLDRLIITGYQRTETVREAGEFAVRGGLIDIFPIGVSDPIRLDFFGDVIDSLRSFDALTQKRLDKVSGLLIQPVSEITLTPDTISLFRSQFREHFGIASSLLYEAISQGRRYAGMEHWLPFFFSETAVLTDYMSGNCLCVVDAHIESALTHYQQQIDEYYQARKTRLPGDKSPAYHPVPPALSFLMAEEVQVWSSCCQPLCQITPFHQQNGLDFEGKSDIDFTQERRTGIVFETLASQIATYKQENKHIVIACMTEGSRARLAHLFEEHTLPLGHPIDHWPEDASPASISFILYPLEKGFSVGPWVVISEQDLLGERLSRRPQRQRKADQFLIEAATLATGDLVVHRDHGVGRYEGLETVVVDKIAHDCLVLTYDQNDRLFLPVENIELISRYGSDNLQATLDRLGAAGWQTRKAKVKKRILEIADYLMKIAAERLLHVGETMIYSAQVYDDFCAGFPYVETEDQARAIADVLEDLSSGKPMDRLICGDVGFGKTEIALRAAFVVAASGKQTAVVVPTTLLCRQHFASFSKRFEGFPFKVAQLSRFATPKEAEKARQGLESGEISVVISTHGIFADKIKFNDLGLMIVDEEQHFGVKQKEKLKQLKKDVHVLTLTATPIPRTLQLALTGVRQMSLITTPPIDRLAVRTFVMPYDGVTIREAILREYYRGGQIFYVSPRLEELATLEVTLRTLVPEIKIGIAHGQLTPSQLEDVMSDFYDRQFDLLLSTNIVESGIDIANANTLILHRSDLFGLSQLYQLRGRIGRSKTQGYAYFTLDPQQQLTANAQKRLDIMQTLDTLGAGFTLASHDMDIRGTGNIVGEEQSGHIRDVGVELYQQLLQEAILTLRVDQEVPAASQDWAPQINLGVSVLIPEGYVRDLGVRLGLYRRLSGVETREDINQFAAELIDRFGPLPEETKNLFALVEIKAFCRQAMIEKLDAGPKGLLVSFKDNVFKNPDKLLTYVMLPQTAATIRPDQKIFFKRDWSHLAQRLKSTKVICAHLAKIAQ